MPRTAPRAAVAAALVFLATIVLANVATTRLGLVPVGFGLLVTAGTFAAGLALVARDAVQETGGRWATLALILAGGALSWALGDGRIAAASAVAFLIGELVDMAVYTPLRRRSLVAAVIASTVVAAPVDTVLFLAVAGFPVTGGAIAGQWLVKIAVCLAAVAVAGGVRALLREPQYAAGA
jgi:queuosine precursor transporter